MRDKTVVLSKAEQDLILNAIAYMVQGGLTAFPLAIYKSAYNKLKDASDPPFPELDK